ncbi:MAG: glyoxalase superfamily protein [Bacteroidota bacterium]
MKNFSHFAAIFPVDDVKGTAEYYRDKLGFQITFEWEDPPSYIVTKNGETVSIHFVKRDDDFKPSSRHCSLYIFVHDVDKLYKEYVKAGVNITNPISTHDYGMRDFDIIDPNGFILTFGRGQ